MKYMNDKNPKKFKTCQNKNCKEMSGKRTRLYKDVEKIDGFCWHCILRKRTKVNKEAKPLKVVNFALT